MTISREAMACTFEVHLPAQSDGAAMEPAIGALDLVDTLEAQLTVYRETSEVISLNATAAVVPTPVEPRLFALLKLAQRISEETEGAFDITTGPLTKAWGVLRRERRLPTDHELSTNLARVGYQHIVLNEESRTVQYTRPDLEIHLNSIGKGYALDRAAEHLDERNVADFLWHGGNSSVLARGSNPTELDGGWRIGIRHPRRPERRLGELLLRNRAAGTSGSGTQFFHHRGRRYGHIIDPRTGNPAEGVFSATVIADEAAEADALATAFFVMGPHRVGEYCQGRPDVGAVLVCPAALGEVEVHVFNLAGEWSRDSGVS